MSLEPHNKAVISNPVSATVQLYHARHGVPCTWSTFIAGEHCAWLWNTNKCERVPVFELILYILNVETKKENKRLQVYLTDAVVKRTSVHVRD